MQVVLTAAPAAETPMTDLDDKAIATREVVRVGESELQTYRLEDTELTEASAIGGSDAYPMYGDFLDVVVVDADHEPLGPRWVECPGDLARALVDAGVEAGDVFTVAEVSKTQDRGWSCEVETDD
jgi:hypothetical protein